MNSPLPRRTKAPTSPAASSSGGSNSPVPEIGSPYKISTKRKVCDKQKPTAVQTKNAPRYTLVAASILVVTILFLILVGTIFKFVISKPHKENATTAAATKPGDIRPGCDPDPLAKAVLKLFQDRKKIVMTEEQAKNVHLLMDVKLKGCAMDNFENTVFHYARAPKHTPDEIYYELTTRPGSVTTITALLDYPLAEIKSLNMIVKVTELVVQSHIGFNYESKQLYASDIIIRDSKTRTVEDKGNLPAVGLEMAASFEDDPTFGVLRTPIERVMVFHVNLLLPILKFEQWNQSKGCFKNIKL